MQLELFINFNGNCRQAVEFYAKVFKSEVHNLMTYSQVPQDENVPVSDADRDRVMYAGIPMGGMTVMFMDMPSDSEFVLGNNINPTVNIDDLDELIRIFNELKEGGQVLEELSKTFFSEMYGMVEDKFGVIWHLLYYVGQ